MERFRTVNDAAHAWVNEFSVFPVDMIERLYIADCADEWSEVTLPSYGDRVSLIEIPDKSSTYEGEIVDYYSDSDTYEIKMDDGVVVIVSSNSIECVDRFGVLPMWGFMWKFKDMLDEDWIDEDGLRALSDCGFRVYYHEEWGYFFGIDGAGYDFYDAHWIPLYKKRGLKWHEREG